MLPAYPESRRRELARSLLRTTLRLHRGEDLLIETWSSTLSWATSLAVEARILGAQPLVSVTDEPSYWASFRATPESALGRVGGHTWAAIKASDAYVLLLGPMDIAREERQPPVVSRRQRSNFQELMGVLQKYGVRSVRWDLGRTSEVWARRYRVNLDTWRNELIDATMVDATAMRREGRWIADRLQRGREATITHPNGTRLTLRLVGRKPKVDDGIVDEQDVREGNVMAVMPSGVTNVTVSEADGDGTFISNAVGVLFTMDQDAALAPGRWTFEDGDLVGLPRVAGADRLRRELARVGSGPLHPGLLGVGLNPGIHTLPLLFDQERGTITLAFGRNSWFGGKTRTPTITGYLDLRGGSLAVDGEPIVERGRLLAR